VKGSLALAERGMEEEVGFGSWEELDLHAKADHAA